MLLLSGCAKEQLKKKKVLLPFLHAAAGNKSRAGTSRPGQRAGHCRTVNQRVPWQAMKRLNDFCTREGTG